MLSDGGLITHRCCAKDRESTGLTHAEDLVSGTAFGVGMKTRISQRWLHFFWSWGEFWGRPQGLSLVRRRVGAQLCASHIGGC